jgi:hypothetical protein
MPPWQALAPHIPVPHPAIGSGAALVAPARAAKVEYCVVKWSVPQPGQRTASASALRLTNCSNLLPQSSQEYSKIGIDFRVASIQPAWKL